MDRCRATILKALDDLSQVYTLREKCRELESRCERTQNSIRQTEDRLTVNHDQIWNTQAYMEQERDLLQTKIERIKAEKTKLMNMNERLTEHIRVLEQKRLIENQYQRLLDEKSALERSSMAGVGTMDQIHQLQRECDRLIGWWK